MTLTAGERNGRRQPSGYFPYASTAYTSHRSRSTETCGWELVGAMT